jgi:hypothetical protein
MAGGYAPAAAVGSQLPAHTNRQDARSPETGRGGEGGGTGEVQVPLDPFPQPFPGAGRRSPAIRDETGDPVSLFCSLFLVPAVPLWRLLPRVQSPWAGPLGIGMCLAVSALFFMLLWCWLSDFLEHVWACARVGWVLSPVSLI